MTIRQHRRSPLVQVSCIVPVQDIEAARSESYQYLQSIGDDTPRNKILTDEVTNARGETTHYSCEMLLSPDDARKMLDYYHAQVSPAQTITREPLDHALQRMARQCQKHQDRKRERQQRREMFDANERRLKAHEATNLSRPRHRPKASTDEGGVR